MTDKAVEEKSANFIRNIVEEDMEKGAWDGRLVTRFPPEPNGHLHIGHAKSILLNYNLAKEFGGTFHLRFDDTNPEKESEEYVEAIKKDVAWLGADWGEHLYFASDYFDDIYDRAVQLIKNEKAYVCELSVEEVREQRGNLTKPGIDSPYRTRSVTENLELFEKMKNGDFDEGKASLRAKIDMSASNMNLRDPILYRIRKVNHHRVGTKWNMYPMYDFTHPLSDSKEKITHSLCTLEFEDHRPLYDWSCTACEIYHPRQIEFSRLNLEYTIMSKRKLLQLVEENHVTSWDDPRMPTVSGMRRRGYTASGISNFCESIGVTKKDSSISMSTLEYAIRDDLNNISARVFAVIEPLKVTITNWQGDDQLIEVANHPFDESFGKRQIAFGKTIYVEQTDFMEEPPKKFFRLSPGGSARLKYAYVITCHEVIKDDNGKVIELKCEYNPETFAGVTPEGMKKVKGIINWVHAERSLAFEAKLYDRLFNVAEPDKDKENSFLEFINPDSLTISHAFVEDSIKDCPIGSTYQFERQGYFRLDEDSSKDKLIFNRVITLKDTWAKR
jgi:glutaminyl-tRNA synthetase